MGGALTALAPDFDRAVLGVPGMNYSTLLQRSVDFDAYAQVIYPAYPDESSASCWLALIQLLWDRGEANGYAQHITDRPAAGHARRTRCCMHVAFGDHQVADITAEVDGAHDRRADPPARCSTPGRSPCDPLPAAAASIRHFPFDGSAIVMWDAGTPPPPITNTPNRAGEDPHGDAAQRRPPRAQQKSEFLKVDGRVVDVCGGGPCYARGYTGP